MFELWCGMASHQQGNNAVIPTALRWKGGRAGDFALSKEDWVKAFFRQHWKATGLFPFSIWNGTINAVIHYQETQKSMKFERRLSVRLCTNAAAHLQGDGVGWFPRFEQKLQNGRPWSGSDLPYRASSGPEPRRSQLLSRLLCWWDYAQGGSFNVLSPAFTTYTELCELEKWQIKRSRTQNKKRERWEVLVSWHKIPSTLKPNSNKSAAFSLSIFFC